MSTFGCHSCGVNLQDWADKPYESWPCAHCALAKNYMHTFSTGFFDTGKAEEIEDLREHRLDDVRFEDEHEFVTSGKFPLKPHEIRTLETIKRALSEQIYSVFSGMLVKLLFMAKKNPTMFEVLIKKMQYPCMSYSDIGNTMNPKCSKQNVLYHLKSAVEAFPELESALLTDTRYSSGHYALRTIADRKKREIADHRIVEDLMRCDNHSVEELNKIIKLPFMSDDEIFTFNAYIDDEEHVEKDGSQDK